MESTQFIREVLEYLRTALGDHYYVSRAALLGVIVSLFRHRRHLTTEKNDLLGLAVGNLFLAIYASSHVAFWAGFPKAEGLFAYLLSMYGMPVCDIGLRFVTRLSKELDVNDFAQALLSKFSTKSTPANENENQAGPADSDLLPPGPDAAIP